jgi:hypothetical protein
MEASLHAPGQAHECAQASNHRQPACVEPGRPPSGQPNAPVVYVSSCSLVSVSWYERVATVGNVHATNANARVK